MINLDKNTILKYTSGIYKECLLNRIMIIGLLSLCWMQAYSQKILVVENGGSTKNFKYFQGDDIILKTGNMETKIFDVVEDMNDSAVILHVYGDVRLDNITCIYRENWLIRTLQGLSLLGGVAYFGIDSFNRLINNDSPVILAETAIISAGLIAFSFALIPWEHRKLKTGGKGNLRTIDLGNY